MTAKPSPRLIRTVGAATALLVVAACAGRAPSPVATTKAGDKSLTCEAMTAEIKTNNEAAHRLAEEHSNKVGRNVAVTTVGVLLFPPLLFALDLKGAQKTEMHALYNRNSYLARLMRTKNCPDIPKVAPPSTGPGGPPPNVDDKIREAEKSGKPPRCKDVGGYVYYKEKTGKICRIS